MKLIKLKASLLPLGAIVAIVLIGIILIVIMPSAETTPLGSTPTPTFTQTLGPTATGIGYPVPTATPEVNVWIDATDEVSAGGNFTAWVNVSNVYHLGGANYDITYDPNILAVIDIDCGSGVIGGEPFPNNPSGFTWAYVPPATQGRIRILQYMNAGNSVDGYGYMARVYFHVVGSSCDSSTIEPSTGPSGGLFKSDTTEIPANWISDSVHVK